MDKLYISESASNIVIRPSTRADHDAIWRILAPVIRAGETYPLPRDMSREAALAYWLAPHHEAFVAVETCDDVLIESVPQIVGTYYLRANNAGGGAHVANCGYIVAADARGRGAARAMCAHSLARAKARGFRAMQFNFVIATNARAVRLWEAMGFAIVGRLPGTFAHPTQGYVDAFVMWREL